MHVSCHPTWGDSLAIAAGAVVLIVSLAEMGSYNGPQTVNISDSVQGIAVVLRNESQLLNTLALSPHAGYFAVGSEDGMVMAPPMIVTTCHIAPSYASRSVGKETSLHKCFTPDGNTACEVQDMRPQARMSALHVSCG